MAALKWVALAAISTFLATGCGGDDSSPASQPAPQSATLMPEDPDLASTYKQTCFACHARGQSGAPLTGAGDAWAARMAKGMDTLLNNTLHGYRGMPPLGACMDCSDEEFIALIQFMATPAP